MADEVEFNLWASPPGPVEPAAAGQGPPRPRRRWRRIVYWVTFGLLCAAAAGLLAGVFMTFGAVRMSSQVMAPTIQTGNRAIYQRGTGGIVRGDVVVVRVPGDDGVLVRRVIGLPGDRVACCDSAGRVTVDGEALNEGYLPPGTAPSQVTFAATLAPGQVWVMGDNRAIAVDSRTFGPLPMSDILGWVFQVSRSGFGDNTQLRVPVAFTADGLAPRGYRFPLPLLLLLLAVLAFIAVIVQGTVGAIAWAVRRSRRKPRQLHQQAT